jgi:hypothetical protein
VPRVSLVILLVGLAALVIAVLGLVRGKLDVFWIGNRKVAAGVLGAAVVLVVIGSVLTTASSGGTTRQIATGNSGPIGSAPGGSNLGPTPPANSLPGAATKPSSATQNQTAPGRRSGGLRCAVLMSNTQPEENHTTEVLVNTAAGASVTATAHFKTATTTHTHKAAATGHTDIPFDVTKGTIGFKVQVDITINANGQSKSCGTSFTPVK